MSDSYMRGGKTPQSDGHIVTAADRDLVGQTLSRSYFGLRALAYT
jgi:hypothetical protein